METLGQSVDSTSISLTPGIAVSKLKINILKYQKSPCLRFDLLGCSNYEGKYFFSFTILDLLDIYRNKEYTDLSSNFQTFVPTAV